MDAPAALRRGARAIAAALARRPDTAHAAAATGPANLRAVAVTRGAAPFYGCLSTRLGLLREWC